MATVTLSRSDVFPVGTSVGIYPAGAAAGAAPGTAVIASGTVDAAGALSVTNAGIVSGRTYLAHAVINGENRSIAVRSTVDAHDYGTAVGTGNTTNGSASVTSLTTSSGTFVAGQTLVGVGIRPGTKILNVTGNVLTLDQTASANGTGVALQAADAQTWKAKLRRRRDALGTI